MREKIAHLQQAIATTIMHPLMPQPARLNLLALGALLEEVVNEVQDLKSIVGQLTKEKRDGNG